MSWHCALIVCVDILVVVRMCGECRVYDSVFSSDNSEGILGGRGLGGAFVHIKALGPIPYPHQRIVGQYPLSMQLL